MYLYEDVYIYVYTDLVSFRDSYWTAAGGGGGVHSCFLAREGHEAA